MGSPNRLKSCCGCYSLKSGTIIAGALGILLSIASIVVILTTKIDFKTIVRDFFKCEFMMIFMASLFVDFRWYYSKRYSQNHSHSQSVHDNNSVVAFDSWCDNREWKCEESWKNIKILFPTTNRKTIISSYHGLFWELCYALDFWLMSFTHPLYFSSTALQLQAFYG